jgi:UDP-N-acetylenolpyruvoylglucosamine reductase
MNRYISLLECLQSEDIKFEQDHHWIDHLGFPHHALIFLEPSIKEAPAILAIVQNSGLPYVIIGETCNTFLSSRYYSIVISTSKLTTVEKDENNSEHIWIGAGEKISTLAKVLCNIDQRASALLGIPGTVGGAVHMNAGAFEIEICNFIKEVIYIEDGIVQNKGVDELHFGYRKSSFQHKTNVLILSIKVGTAAHKQNTQCIDRRTQAKFRGKYLEYSKPNLGSSMATKHIYDHLKSQATFRYWDIFRKTIVVRALFFLYRKIFNRWYKITGTQQFVLPWLFISKKKGLRILPRISDKTLNTFCFDIDDSFAVNKKLFLQYITYLRKSSNENLREEIRIL